MNDPWQILVVDDQSGIAIDIAELLNSGVDGDTSARISAVPEESFDRALSYLSRGEYDILVLDVLYGVPNQGPRFEPNDTIMDGSDVFETIRSQRFIPTVFYTALPEKVNLKTKPPFVQVVSKSSDDPIADLRRAISDILDSGFLLIYRALKDHVENVVREYMIEFMEDNWDILPEPEADLAHLLLRRLSVSLEGGANTLTDRLGVTIEDSVRDGIHPTRFYVVPLMDEYRMGDILCGSDAGDQSVDNDDVISWYVILTPSCDLVQNKAEFVVVAKCLLLDTFSQYTDWRADQSNSNKASDLKNLLKSRPRGKQHDRYHYLPAAWDVPNLMVDLQRTLYIPYDQLASYRKVGSLDSPFSEALSNRFNRFIGRVGTPDLDFDAALDQMREAD